MPAKPLTPEQQEDAGRLKALFETYQNNLREAGEPWAQEVLAERLGIGQSATSQYLNGKIPLNADALLAFSALMGTQPEAISPSIYREAFEWSLRWVNPSAANILPRDQKQAAKADQSEEILVSLWRKLTPELRPDLKSEEVRERTLMALARVKRGTSSKVRAINTGAKGGASKTRSGPT